MGSPRLRGGLLFVVAALVPVLLLFGASPWQGWDAWYAVVAWYLVGASIGLYLAAAAPEARSPPTHLRFVGFGFGLVAALALGLLMVAATGRSTSDDAWAQIAGLVLAVASLPFLMWFLSSMAASLGLEWERRAVVLSAFGVLAGALVEGGATLTRNEVLAASALVLSGVVPVAVSMVVAGSLAVHAFKEGDAPMRTTAASGDAR